MTIYVKNVCSRKEQNTFKSGVTNSQGGLRLKLKSQTSNMSSTKTKYMMHSIWGHKYKTLNTSLREESRGTTMTWTIEQSLKK